MLKNLLPIFAVQLFSLLAIIAGQPVIGSIWVGASLVMLYINHRLGVKS